MNTINSVEEAYSVLAQDIVRFIDSRAWDKAGAIYRILPGMISSEWWCEMNGVRDDDEGGSSTMEESKLRSAAVRYLRDNLLRTTGDLIWGLTFTLSPTGKICMEYDYNKPEGYEETDETNSLGEALNSLQNIIVGGNTIEQSPELRELRHTATAMSWLQARVASDGAAWGLGSEANWNVDLNQGWVSWSFADGTQMQAPVQVVGTYNTQNNTFMWGWDHPSIPEPLRRAALHAFAFGEKEDLARLTTRIVSCTQDEAWQFTALASQLDNAAGAYRGNANGTWVYMAYGTPTQTHSAS